MALKIDSFSISNYKSIEQTQIKLESGLNILIGENGAGKSNILQFIFSYFNIHRFNSRLQRMRNILTSYSFNISHLDKKLKTKYELKFDVFIKQEKDKSEYFNSIKFRKKLNSKIVFENEVEFNSKSSFKDNNFFGESGELRNIRKKYIRFNLPDLSESYWIGIQNKLEIDSNGFGEFEDLTAYSLFYSFESQFEYGSNLNITQEDIDSNFTRIRDSLFDKFSEFKQEYELEICLQKFTPIQGIRLNPNLNIFGDEKKTFIENLIIDFKIQDKWVSWNYLSDGTKRLFYLITETLSMREGILLIEEPELGIHPHQLYSVMQFLKEQSASKQIIISTHSPIVLDILTPDQLKSIIVAKMTKKGTKLTKLNKQEILKAQKYMEGVGELSYYWLHSDLEKND
jgi:predicted ATPase